MTSQVYQNSGNLVLKMEKRHAQAENENVESYERSFQNVEDVQTFL